MRFPQVLKRFGLAKFGDSIVEKHAGGEGTTARLVSVLFSLGFYRVFGVSSAVTVGTMESALGVRSASSSCGIVFWAVQVARARWSNVQGEVTGRQAGGQAG